MQSPDEKAQQSASAGQRQSQEPELSEAWRALLGLQSSDNAAGMQEVDPAAQVPPQRSDPWSHLLHAQGMQPVDLQKLHLRDLLMASNDDDVEHALNIMREATGQLSAGDEKTREA